MFRPHSRQTAGRWITGKPGPSILFAFNDPVCSISVPLAGYSGVLGHHHGSDYCHAVFDGNVDTAPIGKREQRGHNKLAASQALPKSGHTILDQQWSHVLVGGHLSPLCLYERPSWWARPRGTLTCEEDSSL